jgi:hypothetical protein
MPRLATIAQRQSNHRTQRPDPACGGAAHGDRASA